MITWKVLLLCMQTFYQVESDGIFECGAHGRFEYCIDGIPGCVIGCHCHPGYYFDTDTKICEPNTKLTLNYRRHYIPEPTRVQSPNYISNIAQTEPFPIVTTHNVIDEHVNDITKNADDLGDWLYNQFFKTIENQVINKTNKDNQLTRRSGRGSLSKHNKLKRRARKKGNKHKKKNKGIRGKLLRIAEDDSLFQSSDSSDSDSGSTDFSRSDSSFESNSDEDHGHKKILLINKKPRPPLPSFIFLPNMNTPYYPPIGLPPPPVMPMYPMVPVPPMMPAPSLLAYQGHVPECDENTTTHIKETTTIPTTKATTSTIDISTINDLLTTTIAQTDDTTSEVPGLRSHYKARKRKKSKQLETIPDEDEELPFDNYEPTRESRQKLIKLLRQKINQPRIYDPSFKRQKKPFDEYMNQLIPPHTLMDNNFNDDVIPKNEYSSPANLENTSELENVDFKYLSQLIHRPNGNQTQDVSSHDYNLRDSLKPDNPRKWSNKMFRDFNVALNSGRRINQHMNNSRAYQADDSYYSNLGRQIATLIRTIDADKERQVNVEIEKVQQKPFEHPYFNENGPRAFWERSVRSPLIFFDSFKNRFDNVKSSNEQLVNIENRVETVASTVPTLSLQQLENLINVMESARSQFQTNTRIKNVTPFTKTLNVNLWPHEMKQPKKSVKTSRISNIYNVKRRKAINDFNSTKPEILSNHLNNMKPNVYPFTDRIKMNKVNDIFIKRELPALRNLTKMYIQPMHKVKDERALHSSEKRYHTMNPTVLNYKNIKKYFFDNNNQYSFQNDDLRLIPPILKTNKQLISPLVPSPYFHHEINHIDYIS